jgi:1-acyl-sn-glycerol-3-phosphate acyltransferase
MRIWLSGNALVMRWTTRVEWQIEDSSQLRKEGWNLIVSNHQSWTDIVVLGHLFRKQLPVPKFFMKHELIYIPLLGLACWGLDMPFMRRYSREFLLRNPHLRGKDIETARNVCIATLPPPSSTSSKAPESRRRSRPRAAHPIVT